VNIDHHSQPVTSAAWAPDGRTFVTGSLDKDDQLCLWDLAGHNLHHWILDCRIQDMAISNDGKKLVIVSAATKDVVVYNFETREREYSFSAQDKISCVSISRDSRYMLISMAGNEVHLYDIETAEIIRKYSGKQQGEFVIRSAFGGSDENMIISGSEGKASVTSQDSYGH
jgi:WD40 repeat protein